VLAMSVNVLVELTLTPEDTYAITSSLPGFGL
jgi:hypothetical protein